MVSTEGSTTNDKLRLNGLTLNAFNLISVTSGTSCEFPKKRQLLLRAMSPELQFLGMGPWSFGNDDLRCWVTPTDILWWSRPRTGMPPGGVPMSGPPMSAASIQGGYQPGPMNSMPNMGSMPAMPGWGSESCLMLRGRIKVEHLYGT